MPLGSSKNPHPSALRSALPLGSAKNYQKWIFWIIIGLIGLIVTAKVCLRKW